MCADFCETTNTSHSFRLCIKAYCHTVIVQADALLRRFFLAIIFFQPEIDFSFVLQKLYAFKQLGISTEHFPPFLPERKAFVHIKYLKKIDQKLELLGTLAMVAAVEKTYKSKGNV